MTHPIVNTHHDVWFCNSKSVLIAVFSAVCGITGVVWADCDSLAHMDITCGKEIQFFGNRNLKPSSTDAQFQQNCGITEEGVKCMTDYSNKCLQGIPGQLAKTIMHSVKEHYEKRCKDKDYSIEFIEHNKCFNDQALFDQFHQCSDQWYQRMQQLPKLNLDLEKTIQSSCCIFHEYQKCIRDRNVDVCHDKNARFWDDTLNEVSDESVNIFCSQLKTPEECALNFPKDVWASIDNPVAAMDANALKEKGGRFQSMFLTILDAISQYKLKQ